MEWPRPPPPLDGKFHHVFTFFNLKPSLKFTQNNNVSIEQNNVTHEIADCVTFRLLGEKHPSYAEER